MQNSPPRRKKSAGDLIKLEPSSQPTLNPDDVIFDPLLEKKTTTSSSSRGGNASSGRPLFPQPPSTSALPQLAQLTPPSSSSGVRVRDVVSSINNGGGATNPFSPGNSLSAVGSEEVEATRRRPHIRTQQRSAAAFTKSSDDLLKSYGLDFSKLSTAAAAMGSASDPFADLDPLASPRKESADSSSNIPSAPPRTKRQQQNWTTFE